MGKIKFEEKGKKISKKDIANLETELNIKLPEDYKTFLLKNNGGSPEEDWCFNFYDENSEESDSVINQFYILYKKSEDEFDDLKIQYLTNVEEGFVPDTVFVIADDPFGNMIGVDLSAENYGKVYFFDHELEDEDGFNLRSLVADSFDEFLEKLFLDEE
jgi:cell wall assembly regulator SMI1